ncbi:MAG: CheR family methyltransferase [Bacteroidales bacterium]
MGLNDSDIQETDIKRFHEAITEYSAYDFSDYSVNSIKRRLFKIMEEYGTDMNRLIKIISNDAPALEEVVKKLTVNTTELFRDPPVWKSILHHLLTSFNDQSTIRIWHPGCSTGQEVYSMMILLDQVGLLQRSDIFASDINTDVMEIAKKGTYRLRFNREYVENFDKVFSEEVNIVSGIEFAPHEKYLTIEEIKDRISMQTFLRKKPIYKKIDLVKDNHHIHQKFDIVICRNVIIYFNYALQNRVLHQFHRTMNRNGLLVLGSHESIIGPCRDLFGKKDILYVRKPEKNNAAVDK